MAFAFFVAAADPMPRPGGRGICAAGLFWALCFLEAWTLFSYAAKPEGLQNNAPFLLAACGALALWMEVGRRRGKPASFPHCGKLFSIVWKNLVRDSASRGRG